MEKAGTYSVSRDLYRLQSHRNLSRMPLRRYALAVDRPAQDADLVLEQVRYYDARASEYDDWFFRNGRYDRGEQATNTWFAELREVQAVLEQLPLDRANLLELAPGTGLWTTHLAPRAQKITGVDASLAMVEVAKQRLGEWWAKVEFVHADLFTFSPTATYDGIVFCFWISHVPRSRLDDFVEMIAGALSPGGFVFFVDSRREPRSTAQDHVLPDTGEELMIRRLDDGREFSIVKNFWASDLLIERFAAQGISLTMTETATYFQVGVGTRR